MAVDLIFETHSISVDNERGVATGWLDGELVTEPRTWQEGRSYVVG
jgi:hypothetical protein